MVAGSLDSFYVSRTPRFCIRSRLGDKCSAPCKTFAGVNELSSSSSSPSQWSNTSSALLVSQSVMACATYQIL